MNVRVFYLAEQLSGGQPHNHGGNTPRTEAWAPAVRRVFQLQHGAFIGVIGDIHGVGSRAPRNGLQTTAGRPNCRIYFL